MSLYDDIDNTRLDALKELGNIGTGNAATSISIMLDRKVEISVPDVKIVPIEHIWQRFKDPEEIVAGANIGIGGELNGSILFLMGTDSIKKMLELMMLPKPDDLTQLDEMTRSAIGELGNIMCSSYIVSLSTFTGLNIFSMPPGVVVDMLTAIVSEVSLMNTEGEDFIIFIETSMNVGEDIGDISGYIIYIPDNESLKKILKKIGLGIDNE
ncbi:MAG TPA: CheY-P phosphatase CheC [Petrotogaceae bacterium]|nr:chemotaxis protein CheC [Petrotogaceae bacterium]HNV05338.1 CheY-P phosphatase CheC [Petrotogaceae bacterium]HNY37973.1 CheY-P phosphatase CheC [Petrotogaceae bacterium]HOG35158.1 CheY-P phosphatase CheC [Petrotogaceae bacterium]HOT32484.1 CheY-P phosphatase CheC [Petrotogaceae bacterium]